MKERIVIVEDDESIRRLVEVALLGNGYEAVGFDNASEALKDMGENVPGLAIFDIMMEGMDGLEAVRLMRRDPALCQIPVIMLTARDTEADKIIGLDSGADDYMTKPFSVLELCARVRARLRKHTLQEPAPEETRVFEGGGVKLDVDIHQVTVDGQPVDMTLKEFELLKLLMKNQNRAVPRAELLREIWGMDFCGETRTLDIHIGTLRHKLGDSSDNSRYIKTVRGIGYRFIGGSKA